MKTLTLLALMGTLAASSITASAAEKEIFSQNDSPFSLLTRHSGKQIELRLKSGDKISGKIKQVGGTFVQLTALTGQEFYDAVVRLDDISAFVIRADGK